MLRQSCGMIAFAMRIRGDAVVSAWNRFVCAGNTLLSTALRARSL